MHICEILGENLNRIRKEKGLSITEFSEVLNMSRSALQCILNGSGNPRCDTIDHIARQLHMDVTHLVSAPDASVLRLTDQERRDLLQMLRDYTSSGRI